MSASIEQIWNIVASRPKFVFSPTTKTKDYADRNIGGQVNSLHEVTQLG